ncbi:hypothetical protein PYCC9005_002491 [Savitreella phatthalungensis]
MGYLGRADNVEDYPTPGVCWRKDHLRTPDGERLAVLTGRTIARSSSPTRITLLYLQGNAGSAPARLPLLSRVLTDLASRGISARCIVPSYRGYWHSTGSPSEAGILIDVLSVFDTLKHEGSGEIILWGHSIGAGFAVLSATRVARARQINAVVLETPFIDTMTVLKSLYPQKWLPYHHLGPWLRTRLDMSAALEQMGFRWPYKTLVLQAEKDEILPANAGAQVTGLLSEAAVDPTSIEHVLVKGALHQDVLSKSAARSATVDFIVRVAKENTTR